MAAQLTFEKKQRMLLPDVFAGLLALLFIFSWGFTIDLSTAETPHVFFIGFFEIFSACLWIYVFSCFVRRWKEIPAVQKLCALIMVLFGIYYVGLTGARWFLQTNINDSFNLFRYLLFTSVIFVLITLNNWKPERVLRLSRIFFALLTVGYWASIFINKNFSAPFPDFCMTYISISGMMVPVLLYVISGREKRQAEKSLLYMDIFSLISSNVILLLCGSRAAAILLVASWIISLFAFFWKRSAFKVQRKLLFAILAGSFLIGLGFYIPNVFYCRSGLSRAVDQNAVSVPPAATKEEVEGLIDRHMTEREALRGTGQDTGAEFHNPPEVSDGIRKYVLLLAAEQLKDDWLFSLKGQTSFTYNLVGFESRSGPHNFIFDYLLAFGAIGTALLAFLLIIPICVLLNCAIKHKADRRPLWGFLLSMGVFFAFGMVQAIFNSVVPLAWLFLMLAYWYQSVVPNSSEKLKMGPLCMLVTSGVLNDSRVIREATIAAESGFDTHMIGRHVPELGETNPDWPFSCHLIDIVRKEASLPARIVERTRIGLAFLKATVKLRPDIIHCNDFDTLPFGFLAAVICDSALVYDSHELWSVNGQVIESRFGSWLVKRIEGFIAPRCDAVISVSHAAGDWLQERYGLKNLEVVTNCPNIETVQHLPKEAKFELLYHGMFAPDRGCEELIGCAEEVKPYGIQIHFRGYGEWMEHYRQLARSAGADNIVFSDKVPSGEVSTAASASHVGVALTRPITKSYELTVSNKLFEYLAAGLPVILSDVPEHRYLNDKYHFGIIIEEMTAEALAQAAIRLKTDEALYQELARNAEAASKELCFEKEGQKLLRIYQEICGENAEYEAEYLHSARG